MFSQVVRGRADDLSAVRAALARWASAAEAIDLTAGVTEDGAFIAVTTCDSEESARAAGGDWQALLDGLAVEDGTRTDVFTTGDTAGARFVQVVRGQVTDLCEARRHKDALQVELATHLPCLLGTLTVEQDGNRFTRVLYFSTEAEARAGESSMPAEVRRRDQAALRLLVGPMEFLDLRDPWLLSRRTTAAVRAGEGSAPR
ncbi:hypothetical protein [Nocardioides caldifontis]|uniref:hypothetical protein n=1 Tax=Nocardioides caldifontis TaxID=2588938 RepID=UPI0011DFA03B|nr:hypothetical protein [Nocardioides caldifontis]